jgi:hypothetical protein
MPRDITTTAYSFDELGPDAQDKAVQQVAERHAGPWWDQSDNDDIAGVMIYTFAEKLGTPGWDKFGTADFPGIPGVTLEAWDLEQGRTIVFAGSLTRDNAPSLPWADGIDSVEMRSGRNRSKIEPMLVEDGSEVVTGDQIDAAASIADAVLGFTQDAWFAGDKEADYKTGLEYAREWCENNDQQEYDVDGELI